MPAPGSPPSKRRRQQPSPDREKKSRKRGAKSEQDTMSSTWVFEHVGKTLAAGGGRQVVLAPHKTHVAQYMAETLLAEFGCDAEAVLAMVAENVVTCARHRAPVGGAGRGMEMPAMMRL